MNRIARKLALIIATSLGCVAAAGNAHALIVTTGCANANLSCTLQELAAGGSITVDGLFFGNWLVDDASTAPVDIAAIVVSALGNQPQSPGLQFLANGQLGTVGLDLIDLDIFFDATSTDGLTAFAASSLQIDQVAFGGGNLGGFIGVSEDILMQNGVDLLGESSAFVDNLSGAAALFDALAFQSSAAFHVATNILVTGDGSDDTVSLGSFTERFYQIPEPSTILLAAIGLLGLRPSGRRTVTLGRSDPPSC